MSEARQLAEERMREIARMSLEELHPLTEAPIEIEIAAPSGRAYRSNTYAFWDTEPYESDLYIRVKVTGQGLKSYQRYYGVETRGPEDEFKPGDTEHIAVSPTWTEIAAWTIFALALVAIPLALLAGVGYLIFGLL